MVSYHADSRETRERFQREAEAAASLDHPNILPIYEIGQGEDGLPFFSMKYAAGGSLQKAAPALRSEQRECVKLIAKVACAVQYAHEHGVLHRDLKPGNILLDGHGEPFVTDFGLAKWLDTTTDLTRTLTIFGTPGYIAPEQAKGPSAKLTPTADVYSLGAILFDLFTGRPPFLGEHALAVIQQASEKPAPKLRAIVPSLDRDLETICARCLEREPQARYRSAADLAVDLNRWLEGRPIVARRVSPPVRAWRWSKRNSKLAAATAAAFCSAMVAAFLLFSHSGLLPQSSLDSKLRAMSAQVKTMAVLPFKVVSADPADEYLGIGLADTLITQIDRIPQILVRRTFNSKYVETHALDPAAAGRLLSVEAVLDGTVQHEAGNIRITARLFRVADGALLWSGKFDQKFTNVFAVHDAISQHVAKTLIRNLNDEDRKLLTKRHTDNVEAYRAYLKGRYFWKKRTPAALQQSLSFFRQALDLDPTYASAYAGMADAYALLVWQEQLPRDEFIARAKAAATKALEIDQTLAEPHATLGYVKFWYDWDFAGAESEFRRAIELNPDYGTAHHWYGESLGMMGRFDDGLKELRLAQQVDPLSPIINADLGKLLFLERQPDQAIEQLRKTLELDPDLPLAHVFLALAWNKKGLYEQAVGELERIANAPGSRAIFKATLGFVYGQSGRRAEALNILSGLIGSTSSQNYVSPFHIALVYVGLDEKDKAIEWLEKAKTERDPFLIYIKVDPNFDSLRDDPHFADLAGWLLREGFLDRRSVSVPEKSIAVLPFENLSRDPDNEFFTDGVQDEILTALARSAGLKVISRTSVVEYKSGVTRDLREIGQQLGVSNVLEGSVQRLGNRVRVNVQLVDTRTDAHVWAQTYDRDLADVFAIQSDIAKAIANQLQAKLSAGEQRAIAQPPTTDLTAFLLYNRAKSLLALTTFSTGLEQKFRQAIDLLNQAVARDQSFFLAYCQLAYTHDQLYFFGYDHTPARLALAEAAIQAAFRLRPDAGEGHLARGENLFRSRLDYDGALTELDIARQTLPNDPRIFELKAFVQHRQGKNEEALGNLQRALELDPRNLYTLQHIAVWYAILRRYTEEAAVLDRGLAINPNDIYTRLARAGLDFDWKADPRSVHQIIDSIRAENPGAVATIADSWLNCALAERDDSAVEAALEALGENTFGNDAVRLSRTFGEGLLARMMNDQVKARSAFSIARAEQEKHVQAEPDYGPALCVLGLIDAGLGRKEEALREGRRALELLPVAKDSVNGMRIMENFAIIAAWVGEKDLACEQLATATRLPGYLSYGQLKLLPWWDPLRGDPCFEKIVASLAPKTTEREDRRLGSHHSG
jgi:serine/threonine-protein kinase